MASVDDDRRRHRVELFVEFAEFLPVRHHEGGARIFKRLGRTRGILDIWELLAHVLGCDRVVTDHVGTAFLQALNEGNRSRVVRVVGTGFECEAEDGNPFARDVDVQVHQREEPLELALVDLDGYIQEHGVVPLLADGVTGRIDVCREATAAPVDAASCSIKQSVRESRASTPTRSPGSGTHRETV